MSHFKMGTLNSTSIRKFFNKKILRSGNFFNTFHFMIVFSSLTISSDNFTIFQDEILTLTELRKIYKILDKLETDIKI